MKFSSEEHFETAAILVHKIHALQIEAKILDEVEQGPTVTTYHITPTGRTKVSQIEALGSDFAVALNVEDVVVKRLPGSNSISVFIPNKQRTLVRFEDCVSNLYSTNTVVPILLGTDHLGDFVSVDLSTLPHLLIAGSTGSGKSTLMHSIVAGLVYCRGINDISLIISDTKGVEFTKFIGVPHLLFEPATSVYQTLEQMDWIIEEVERRLKLFSGLGTRNISEYRARGKSLASIILVIDELADLLTDRTKPEGSRTSLGKIVADKLDVIVRRSRASGVYVIAGTQRPSVNIVSGTIKANFPARISFRLPTQADSVTILGTGGAEHLLSQGDMLFLNPNASIQRIHAPFSSLTAIEAAVEMAIRK